MRFYRNILIAAALIPAAALTLPLPYPRGNNDEQPRKEIQYNKIMPSERQYRKFIQEPAASPTSTPIPEMADYQLALWHALGTKGVAPLREVDGYNPVILAEALMETESTRNHYDPDGSVKRGGSGEIGIVQILPSTGEAACGMSADELMGIQNNVACGMIYLSDALVTCKGNVIGALTNYNRGSSGQCVTSGYSETVLKNYELIDNNN